MAALHRLIGGLAAALIALSATGCGDSHRCPLIACASAVKITVAHRTSYQEFNDSRIRFCHNSYCLEGPVIIPDFPVAPSVGQFTLPDSSGEGGRVVIIVSLPSDAFRLDIEYTPVSPDALVDGDQYTVSITDLAQQVTPSFQEQVSAYEVTQNGPQCGPACKTATFNAL